MMGDPLTAAPAREANVTCNCICTSLFWRMRGSALTVNPRSSYCTVGAKANGFVLVVALVAVVPVNKLESVGLVVAV